MRRTASVGFMCEVREDGAQLHAWSFSLLVLVRSGDRALASQMSFSIANDRELFLTFYSCTVVTVRERYPRERLHRRRERGARSSALAT